jgi:hypothetical protein
MVESVNSIISSTWEKLTEVTDGSFAKCGIKSLLELQSMMTYHYLNCKESHNWDTENFSPSSYFYECINGRMSLCSACFSFHS